MTVRQAGQKRYRGGRPIGGQKNKGSKSSIKGRHLAAGPGISAGDFNGSRRGRRQAAHRPTVEAAQDAGGALRAQHHRGPVVRQLGGRPRRRLHPLHRLAQAAPLLPRLLPLPPLLLLALRRLLRLGDLSLAPGLLGRLLNVPAMEGEEKERGSEGRVSRWQAMRQCSWGGGARELPSSKHSPCLSSHQAAAAGVARSFHTLK